MNGFDPPPPFPPIYEIYDKNRHFLSSHPGLLNKAAHTEGGDGKEPPKHSEK